MGQICSKNIKKADMNIPMTVNRTYNGIDEEEQLPLRHKLEEDLDSRHLTFDKGGSCNIVGNGSDMICTQFEDGAPIVERDDEYEKMLVFTIIKITVWLSLRLHF